jgi:hypothetical protein
MTAVRTTVAAALTATLGLAAACWMVSVWQMTGMDRGVAPGSARSRFRRGVGGDDGGDDAAGARLRP